MDSVQGEVDDYNVVLDGDAQLDVQRLSQNNSRAVSRESSFNKAGSRRNSEVALEVKWSDITINFGDRRLLHRVSGSVQGKFLAIMGGSGSGKTTLLNYLARRMQRQMKKEDGVSHLNGVNYSRSTLKQVSGYVVQDDLLFGNLTVEETLQYSARLRLPADVSDEERKERVEDALTKLGLAHCRNTIIGDELKRGVSGGERKRVCVAVELLMRPNVLMLDEPTSGLDSASALSLCQTLKELAESGSCTVICTIHQPQTKIFNLFDELIILNKGHVLYQGLADEVIAHYTEAGFPCPPYTNPADHILDVVTFVSGCDEKQIIQNQKTLEEFMTIKRKVQAGNADLLNEYDFGEMERKAWKPPRANRAPWLKQFAVLSQRSVRDTIRSRTTVIAQVLQNIIVAVLIGTVFYNIGADKTSVSKRMPVLFFCAINQGVFGALIVINSFPSERKIVLRERAAGSYYVSAYYMAKIVSETLLQFTSPLVFSAIVYWLVGFQYSAAKFFIFASFMVLCSLSATSIALFISAVCRTTTLAVSVLPLGLEVARLFGGYFLSPANLPKYFSWLDALSYAKYTYVGIALNELTGLQLSCTTAQQNAGACPRGEDTISTLGLDTLSINLCASILVVMIVFFRIGAYLAIRFIKW